LKTKEKTRFVQEIFQRIKDLIIEKEKSILEELEFCYREKMNYLDKTLGNFSFFSLSMKSKISVFESETEKRNFYNVQGVDLKKSKVIYHHAKKL